jgi:hypothetical protein
VLDLGGQPHLLQLSSDSSLSFSRVDLQGGLDLHMLPQRGAAHMMRQPTQRRSSTGSAQFAPPSNLDQPGSHAAPLPHSLPTLPCPPGAAGAAPFSAVVHERTTWVVGSPVWPTVDGDAGHQLLFQDLTVHPIVTPCSRNSIAITVGLLKKVSTHLGRRLQEAQKCLMRSSSRQ